MKHLKPINLPPDISARRIVSVSQACEILNISRDTLKRRHKHLIVEMSPRRRGVQFSDLIVLMTPAVAAAKAAAEASK